jgi:hypothetical protein
MTREQRLAAQVLASGRSNAEAAKAAKVSVRQVQRWKVEVVGFLDAMDGVHEMVTMVGAGERFAVDRATEPEAPALERNRAWVYGGEFEVRPLPFNHGGLKAGEAEGEIRIPVSASGYAHLAGQAPDLVVGSRLQPGFSGSEDDEPVEVVYVRTEARRDEVLAALGKGVAP